MYIFDKQYLYNIYLYGYITEDVDDSTNLYIIFNTHGKEIILKSNIRKKKIIRSKIETIKEIDTTSDLNCFYLNKNYKRPINIKYSEKYDEIDWSIYSPLFKSIAQLKYSSDEDVIYTYCDHFLFSSENKGFLMNSEYFIKKDQETFLKEYENKKGEL